MISESLEPGDVALHVERDELPVQVHIQILEGPIQTNDGKFYYRCKILEDRYPYSKGEARVFFESDLQPLDPTKEPYLARYDRDLDL